MSIIRRDVTTGGNARFQSLLPPLLSMLRSTANSAIALSGLLRAQFSEETTRSVHWTPPSLHSGVAGSLKEHSERALARATILTTPPI